MMQRGSGERVSGDPSAAEELVMIADQMEGSELGRQEEGTWRAGPRYRGL